LEVGLFDRPMLYGCLHSTVCIKGNNEALLLPATRYEQSDDRQSIPRTALSAHSTLSPRAWREIFVCRGPNSGKDLEQQFQHNVSTKSQQP